MRGWILLAAATVAAAQQRYSLPAPAQYSAVIVLRPAQTSGESSFAIDPAETVSLQVLTNSNTIQVSLVDPSGAEYLAGAAGGPVVSSVRVPFEKDGKPADSFAFVLRNPAAGRWTVRATEPSAFTGVRVAIVRMISGSDLAAALVGADRDVPLGRPVTLALILPSNSDIAVSSARGTARRSGAAETALTFRDTGNGVRSATFTPSEAGDYVLSATVEGTRNGSAFIRSTGGWLRITRPCGTLSRTVTPRSVDLNNNQRPDVLELGFTAAITRAAKVHLAVEISASNGKRTIATTEATLETGSRPLPVRFDLRALRELEAQAPFEIASARLSCVESEELLLSDAQSALGSTGAFSLTAAERQVIVATGSNTERTIDSNNNARWDQLEYSVGLDLLAAGSHRWSAALFDGSGKRVASASGAGVLAAGRVAVALQFDGTAIGRNAIDGPYVIAGFVINGPNGSAASIPRAGQTQAYAFDSFEGAPARPTAPLISRGGVVNAANFQPRLARGAIATVFGSNFATQTVEAAEVPLPRTLAGVKVTVGGIDAPLFFVSATQINFQVPFETPLNPAVAVVVTRNGVPSAAEAVAVQPYAIGAFTYTRAPGIRDPIVLHANGDLVTPANPASAGEVLLLFATGAGDLNNPPATGDATPASPLATTRLTPVVTLGGASVRVLFSGLTPGFAGLVQLNLQLPAQLPAGPTLPLAIELGTSTQTVNLALR